MSINLEKGSKINLTKAGNGDHAFYIGLYWEEPLLPAGHEFDLDASALCCYYDENDAPKLLDEKHFVFYNNLSSPDGAVKHSGDILSGSTGGSTADTEVIKVWLDKLDPRATEVSFIVSLDKAEERGQNFGQARKAKIRICDMDANGNAGTEIAKFNLTDDYSNFSAVQPGSLYKRDDGDWAFNASGAGFNKGLAQVLNFYGYS
jgi:tellurium resistance protein TerD